jgi:hypothetical protein
VQEVSRVGSLETKPINAWGTGRDDTIKGNGNDSTLSSSERDRGWEVLSLHRPHAEDILPFGISQGTKLRPVIHSGSFIGIEVPVWDIADNFGDTNLLVTNMAQASDLAKCLGESSVALMRGHGFASAARSLIEVVRLSVYLPRNARALMRARQLGGGIKYLSQGEIEARNRGYSPYSVETWRTWEYWANKAGCGHLLTRPDGGHAHPPKG